MKKLVLVLMVLLLASIVVFIGGCSRGSAADPLALTPTGVLTVEIFDRGTDGGRTLAYDNAWTNWIKEKVRAELGIEVTFIPVGRWSEDTDIVNLMASGSAPDLCYTYSGGMVSAFRDQGGLLNLAPYIDTYLPDLKRLLGEDTAYPGMDFIYRNRDPATGHIYSIPSYRVITAQRNTFIRKDWLDILGLPVPTNMEEFYQALVAFRDRDPGNVGINRVVPYGQNSDARWGLANLINHFIDPNMTVRDRWVYNIAERNILMSGYKEGVREMNKWYNEGLIFRDFPLMTTADDFYNQMKSGVVGAFSQNWDMPYRTDYNILVELRRNVPNADYIPIDITRNKDVMDKVGLQIFIPSYSPNKDAALKYLNWLAKPENFGFLQLGALGVNHEMVNGIPRSIATSGEWIQNSGQNIDYTMPMNGIELGSPEANARVMGLSYGAFSPDVIADAYVVSTRNARAPAVWQATTLVNQYTIDLQERADALLAQAITAPAAQFDSIWDNGIRAWRAAGADEVFDERSSLYPQ